MVNDDIAWQQYQAGSFIFWHAVATSRDARHLTAARRATAASAFCTLPLLPSSISVCAALPARTRRARASAHTALPTHARAPLARALLRALRASKSSSSMAKKKNKNKTNGVAASKARKTNHQNGKTNMIMVSALNGDQRRRSWRGGMESARRRGASCRGREEGIIIVFGMAYRHLSMKKKSHRDQRRSVKRRRQSGLFISIFSPAKQNEEGNGENIHRTDGMILYMNGDGENIYLFIIFSMYGVYRARHLLRAAFSKTFA